MLVDDHVLLREGLASLFRAAGFEVAGEGRSGEDAVALVNRLHPDVVVMDVSLDGMNGIEAARKICSAPGHRPPIVMLSMHRAVDTVERALRAGARGYVLKGGDFRDLVRAIDTVLRGEQFVAEELGRAGSDDAVARAGEPSLTAREEEILGLVAEGYSSKEIASQLGLSPRTVDNHRANMMQKLQIHSTAGLVRYFLSSRKQ